MHYTGVIIEESLENKEVLKDVKILETKVEGVTEEHKTPWMKQWTLHTVEITEDQADAGMQIENGEKNVTIQQLEQLAQMLSFPASKRIKYIV